MLDMSTTLTAEHFRDAKYGKLRMRFPIDSSRGSHKVVEWNCDCGKTVSIAVCTVVSGNTSSCRKCNLLTEEHMASAIFGKLRLKNPRDIMPGSREKLVWTCACGKEVINQALYVITLKSAQSCG